MYNIQDSSYQTIIIVLLSKTRVVQELEPKAGSSANSRIRQCDSSRSQNQLGGIGIGGIGFRIALSGI